MRETLIPTALLDAIASYASSPEGAVWVLCGARLFGVTLTAALLVSRLLAVRLRLAFSVIVVLLLAAGGSASFARETVTSLNAGMPFGIIGAVVIELGVGALIGWSATIVVAAVRAAATHINEQTGFGYGGILDPSTPPPEPPLRGLMTGLALFALFAADLHHRFLRCVLDSFEILPPGTVAADGVIAACERVVAVSGVVFFEATLVLAFPVTAALLLASVAQGVLTRLFPELETVLFGFMVRAFVAMGVLALALPVLASLSAQYFGAAVEESKALARLLR